MITCPMASSYLELITYCHSTFKIDKIARNYRKTANIIEKTSVYHTVNDKGYITKQHVDILRRCSK